VEFGSRDELEKMDQRAKRLGGQRASAEFRPITAYVHRDLKRPHTAVYVFQSEICRDLFVAVCRRE
jgi:hypothetical protein